MAGDNRGGAETTTEGPETSDLKNGATEITEGTEKLRTFRGDPRTRGPLCGGLIIAPGRAMLTDPFGTSDLTEAIIGCGVDVHRVIGPGVLESVYAECMEYELAAKGLSYERGRAVPIVYKGAKLKSKYFVDFVVENCVVVELKAVERLVEVHRRQLLTQLKLAGLPVGLLMNFNVALLTAGGVKRVVNPQFAAQVRDAD